MTMISTLIPTVVEDPLVSEELGFRPERVRTSKERFFLDGPISERIAIIDRDPASGLLAPPVRWQPGKTGGKFQQPPSPEGQMALSTFGIVLETLEMFERPDILGHRVTWAFGSPQLLVVPRAGIWQNAFYDRFARALQFFSFDTSDGRRVHTANSRDIVSHEMGHAVVDALLPALYDGLTPQTQALHEAIADLTAMSMAFKSRQIRDWLVRNNKADLQGDSPITQLAQEFATRRGDGLQGFHPLRNLFNNKTLASLVDPTEPHALCEVLTGAVWAALVRLHDYALEKAREDPRGESLLGAKLRISGERFARILFRALDYLPPAEATFVDYARALLCSDTVAVPGDSSGYREVLKDEFQRRGIIQSLDELGYTPVTQTVQADFQALIESDWAAFQFAEAHRELLNMPVGCPFRLFPRYLAKRQYWRGGTSTELCGELIFRVTWEEAQEAKDDEFAALLGVSGARRHAEFHGTTLVIEEAVAPDGPPDRHRVLACLTTDSSNRQRDARRDGLRRLLCGEQVQLVSSWEQFNRTPLAPAVFGRVTDGTLRLRGTARLLHLAGDAA